MASKDGICNIGYLQYESFQQSHVTIFKMRSFFLIMYHELFVSEIQTPGKVDLKIPMTLA